MLTIAGKPYLNLDSYLPLNKIPDIEDAVIESYDLINQNCWQRTFKLDGSDNNCNWFGNRNAKTTKEYFEVEIRNKTVAPYWVLDLTQSDKPLNIYDSFDTPQEYWDAITFRNDLSELWNPMIDWIKNLNCFDKIGRSSLLLTRPGIPIEYHRDTGQKDSEFIAKPHRQEFIWLNMTPEKTVYVLDENRNPIQFDCRAAFFNHNNWHGSHESLPYWSFSFKIEGIFNQSFREQAGFGHINRYYYEE